MPSKPKTEGASAAALKLTAAQKRKLAAFVAAKRAAAKADADLAGLKDDVSLIVKAQGGAIAYDGARLSITEGAKFDYTACPAVGKADAKLKAAKQAAQEDGSAIRVAVESLRCVDVTEGKEVRV